MRSLIILLILALTVYACVKEPCQKPDVEQYGPVRTDTTLKA